MLCRKCGENFEGSGIYCPFCLNAAKTPVKKSPSRSTGAERLAAKLKQSGTKRPSDMLRELILTPLFLAAATLFTVAAIIDLFGVLSYLGSVDAYFEGFGVVDILDKTAPGIRITVFIDLLIALALAIGLWTCFFDFYNKRESIGFGIKILEVTTLVKYIYSILYFVCAFFVSAVLARSWNGVLGAFGFTHLLWLGTGAVLGVCIIGGLWNIRLCSEINRNIKEASLASDNIVNGASVSLFPAVFSVFIAILLIFAGALLGNILLAVTAALKLLSSILFATLSVRFKRRMSAFAN